MVVDVPADIPVLQRGQYVVEALGRCAACHTPRNILSGLDPGAWMAGGRAPEGHGRIRNITPHADGIGDWSETDIVYSVETGFTSEFDSFASTMAGVQLNMAQLSEADRQAIAAYLKHIPAIAFSQ